MTQTSPNGPLDGASDAVADDGPRSLPGNALTEPLPADAQRFSTGFVATIQKTAVAAERLTGFVRWSAWAFASGGLWLWLSIFIPALPWGIWQISAAVVGLVLLSMPAIVFFLFGVGLRQLIEMPGQLVEMAAQGRQQAGELARTVSSTKSRSGPRRLFQLLRSLLELGSLGGGSRDLVLQGVFLVRLLNPLSLVTIAASFLFGCLITFVALVTLLIRALL